VLFGLSEESVSEEGVSVAGVVSPPADLVIGEGAMTNEILAYDFFDLFPLVYRGFFLWQLGMLQEGGVSLPNCTIGVWGGSKK